MLADTLARDAAGETVRPASAALADDHGEQNMATRMATRAIADGPLWRIRVSLLEVEPAIWREFEVSARLTFAQLHAVIQAAMGWDDAHLYAFSAAGGEIDGEQDAHRLRLDELCQPGDTFGYT